MEAWHGRLALSPDPPRPAAWALDTWLAPQVLPAPSVKAAADALRTVQRNWSLYAAGHHRRAALIQARLPHVGAKPLHFPQAAPTAPLGAWTLLAPDTMLASPSKTSPFPNGECRFQEDRTGPPSRAYLKLWEALTLLGAWPGPGERCLDLGASPGGWTWALAQVGAEVVAVDRAPLDSRVVAMPGVTWRQGDAFAQLPEPVDWLVCDVVAYPARTLELARCWAVSGCAGRIVCTVKFQGETDHGTAEAFRSIPGGMLRHLHHNKHELTWTWSSNGASAAIPTDAAKR